MVPKFVGFIPSRGQTGDWNYAGSTAEEFNSHENAKVWIGRKLVSNPEIDSGFIYRLESEVRLNKLIADHTEVVDRR